MEFSKSKKQSAKTKEARMMLKYLSRLVGFLFLVCIYATPKLAMDLERTIFADYSFFILSGLWILFIIFVWGGLIGITRKLDDIDRKLHWYESEMEPGKLEEG
ncbi:hypothetical protein L2D08_14300 [Domibacillus sp. PGB-M46]|uniref:hypothetical protein n=1 Tax=Domibacillus sp. PGB-M46 TaxID=2910255 RepID=UPI001F593DD6|nr:hypothetical protein [Domibacillus sp. PGB-M46]MCI2255542.1 hypothetical protein [Domibacillus sp. PGB-M46]